MIPIDNHRELALERLLEQDKHSNKMRLMFIAFTNRTQSLEDTGLHAYNYTKLANAYGKTLDYLGANYGVKRLGRKDADFRQAIWTQIFINHADGTLSMVSMALRLLYNPIAVRITEYKAYVKIALRQPKQIGYINETMQAILSAGIGYSVIYEPEDCGYLSYISTSSSNLNVGGVPLVLDDDSTLRVRHEVIHSPANPFRLGLKILNKKSLASSEGGNYFLDDDIALKVVDDEEDITIIKGSSLAMRLH